MTPTRAWRSRLRAILRDPLTVPLGLTSALLVLVLVFAVSQPAPPPPKVPLPAVSVAPIGAEVSQLTPIVVTYPLAPAERDGTKMLAVDPPIAGTYAWLGDRTLLYQPSLPGYERGREYTVRVAPQPDASVADELVHTFTAAGVLNVAMVIPSEDDEDVVAESPILVQFTRSVAPLTTLAEMAKQGPVLEFDPPLAGRGEWVNTALYRFTPARPFPPNTQYRVHLVSGLSAASDGQLAEPYDWSFTTYRPAVVKVTPADNTVWAEPRQPVTLEFNQPMSRSEAEAAFSLRASGEPPVSGRFAWADDDRRLTFTPDALTPEGRYMARLAEGVPGRTGGTTRIATESAFKTTGPPRAVNTQPRDGEVNARPYGVTITFNNPMDEASFEGRVSISEHRADELNIRWTNNNTVLYVYTGLRPSTLYEVRIASGGLDRFGQAAGEVRFAFTTQASPSTVSLITPGSTAATYSAFSTPALFFSTMNTSDATFHLYRLSDAEYRTARTKRPRDWRPTGPPIRTWTEQTEARQNWLAAWETQLTESGPLPTGKYYVEVAGGASTPTYASDMLFAVVDTALVLKTAEDELLVWAIDLATGKPLSDTQVDVVEGTVEGPRERRTDANGIARFPLRPRYSYSDGARAEFVQVTEGGRQGVAGIEWGNTYSQYGGYVSSYSRQYAGHLYGDRPLYRPGERLELKGVIRFDDDAAYPIPPTTTKFTVAMEGRQQISSQQVTLNEFGSFVASLDLPVNMPLGQYSVTVRPADVPPDRAPPIAVAQFYVAEFRPAEFEVRVQSDPLYTAGETIRASVDATYLFGGAVADTPLTWNVSVSPRVLRGTGKYAAYSFNDIDQFRTSVAQPTRRIDGQTATDERGRAEFAVPTGDVPEYMALDYTLSASVVDQSGQALSGSTQAQVYPGDILPAVRADQYLGVVNQPTVVRFLAMTTTGGDAANREVAIRIFRREWITSKVQNSDGSKSYRSQPVDTLVEEITGRTNAESEGEVRFTPSRPAVYRIVAETTDDRGRKARAATYQWVSGPEYAPWRIPNNDSFELVADRDGYAPGDTAEILVPAPFDRAIALVTVERGKNIRQEVRRFDTNSERIRIPVDDGSVPNIYVSVVLFRPASAEDPIERFARATVNLRVSTDSKRLNVSITADRPVAQPRDTVKYAVRVTDSSGNGVRAELSVAVVDKAVLLLTEERGPDGMRASRFERSLGVATASSLAVSVDRANDNYRSLFGGSKGGDGFSDDGTRKEFKNTAFWQGQVVTDANGDAIIEVPLPDNVTTWRLQARAVAEGTRVGEAVHELLTTKATLARPTLPRFARVGDAFSLRMLVRNGTDRDVDATATVAVRGIDLGDSEPRQIRVPAGRSTFAEWPARVTSEDPFEVTFAVTSSSGQRDSVQLQVPVRQARTPETTATGGVIEGDRALEAVFLPEFAITAGGKLEVTLAPSLIPDLGPEMSAFRVPPRDNPGSLSQRLRAALGVHLQGRTDMSSTIRSNVAGLIAFAQPGGAWAWCDACQPDPELSAFALTTLGEARGAGFEVNDDVLSAARSYLRAQLAIPSDAQHPSDPNRRAKLLYAIVRSGRTGADASTVRALFEQSRAQLNPTGRAYLLLAMNEVGIRDSTSRTLLTDLTASAITSANGNHWESPVEGTSYTEPTVQTTSIAIQALSRVSPRHLVLRESVRWLVFARADEKRSLFERAESIYALGSFAAVSGERAATYPYSIRLNDTELASGTFDVRTAPAQTSKRVPLTDLKLGTVNVLEFLRSGQFAGGMYYTATLVYQVPGERTEAVNRGFGLAREYSAFDDPSTPLSEIRVGDVVRVKLTIIASAERRQVELSDPLPAGLEPIDPKLKVASAVTKQQLGEEQRKAGRDSAAYVAPWFRWYYSPWESVQLRDDRVELRATRLPKGVHEYIYIARATTPGTFFAPPTVASEANFPENFGRSDPTILTVQP